MSIARTFIRSVGFMVLGVLLMVTVGYSKAPIQFDGTIVDWTGRPVFEAEVSINNTIVRTNKRGQFKIELPEHENDDMFMVNVYKPGHGLFSRIFDKPINDRVWQLPPATTIVADPTQPIVAQAPFQPGACQGALSSRVDWSLFPNQYQPVSTSSSGAITPVTLPADLADALQLIEGGTPCSSGFTVQIPANALVDANGAPPAGKVNVTVSTVDLYAPNGMPGDLTVEMKEGVGVMESFGAGAVEIYADGTSYNLRPGMSAKLTIPVDPMQLKLAHKSLDPTIPLLLYDELHGIWTVEGTMQLNATGDAYEAKVGHFSVFNADLVKTDQSCVRINSQGIPSDYDLEVTIPIANRAPVVLTRAVDNTPETLHVVYNLPNFTDIVLRPFVQGQGGPVPLGTFMINTGGPQNPTSPNRPVYPYTACQNEAILTAVSSVTITIENTERYDLISALLNGVQVLPPGSFIPPNTGLSVPQGIFPTPLAPGDTLTYDFQFGPAAVGTLYTYSGSDTVAPGNNAIQGPGLNIGRVMTLFQPTRTWTGSYFDGVNTRQTSFVFTENDEWTLFVDGQPIGSGIVEVRLWNDNAANITIGLGAACSGQDIVLVFPFGTAFAEFFCTFPLTTGGTVTVAYVRQ